MKNLSLIVSSLCWIMFADNSKLCAQDEAEPAPNPNLVDEIFNMSPEELLNLPTRLTTGDDQGWLETPGAAYLITREELR